MSRNDWITLCCVLVIVCSFILFLMFMSKALPGN
jgi:hypothetical protein